MCNACAMSLSQKHPGLVLVPWFNSHEWHYVYHSAYSSERDEQLKALELLKIWKLRTPILSTGVEGTLILLDVLLLDTEQMTSEQVSQLYALALMRFLNLSAANSNKQGSFMKTSEKHELPKWVINLRHDVAHGHQLPSLSNLKMGLDFGFRWLKEKYWEPQSKIIKDYFVNGNATTDDNLSVIEPHYVEVNMALFENRGLEREYMETVKELIYKELRKRATEPCFMLGDLLEIITLKLKAHSPKNKRLCLDELVSHKGLLKAYFEVLLEEEGNERLDINFRNIWESLLNAFHQFGLLFGLIENLFEVIGSISYSHNCRKMAAMWIKEILVSLYSLKSKESSGIELKLEPNEFDYATEALNFEKRALTCSDQYTIYFLDSLLKYNLNDDSINCDVLLDLVTAKSFVITDDYLHQEVGKIYTLEDLKMECLSLCDVPLEIFAEKESSLPEPHEAPSLIIKAGPKWQKLQDTSMFQNCPLGVLPHQRGQKHPFLDLS